MSSILTTVQAARELGFERRTICRLCETGRLVGAYRAGVGGHWRIPMAALEAFRARTRPVIRRRTALA